MPPVWIEPGPLITSDSKSKSRSSTLFSEKFSKIGYNHFVKTVPMRSHNYKIMKQI